MAVVDVITRMQELNGSLSSREQRVADYILGNLETAAYQNQNEIAHATSVSEATVTRFCQRLGCDGFRDFRVRFAQSVAVTLPYFRASQVGGEDGVRLDDVIDQVFGSAASVLALARNQLNAGSLEAAVEMLASSRRIAFIGVGGSSSNLAAEGANRFFRLGIPCESQSDGYYQRMLASTLGEGDAVFAISASGGPQELIDSVGIACQYKARSVSLTQRGSPLAAATDVSIELELPEDQDIYKPTASRLAYLAVLDVIATGVARAHPDRVKRNLRRIRTSLVQVSQKTGPSPIGD